MKSKISKIYTLIFFLLTIFSFISCDNFFNKNKGSVGMYFQTDLCEKLYSRAADNNKILDDEKFIINATLIINDIYSQSQSKPITKDDKLISIVFPDISYESEIVVEVSILSNDTIIYSGKSEKSTVSTPNVSINLSLTKNFSSYTVSYELNSGKWAAGYTPPASYDTYRSLDLPLKENLIGTDDLPIFAGWYEDSDFLGDRITTIAKDSKENKTFYAKWETNRSEPVPESYTVSYDYNIPGDSTSIPSKTKTQGTELQLISDLSREDYIFIGWNTKQDGSGTSYEPGANYSEDKDITLYAIWVSVTTNAENVSTIISSLPAGGPYTINVTGEISNTTIEEIATALKAKSKSYVELHLAETTGLTEIAEDAFKDVTNLIYINLPQTVTSINKNAFANCSILENIYLSSNIQTIGESAFDSCTSLSSFTIPEGVITIEEETFYYCENLSQIEIPSTVTEIKDYAFSHCVSLSNIIISDSNQNFKVIDNKIIASKQSPITLITYPSAETVKDVVIPDEIERIKSGAFFINDDIATIKFNSGTWYNTLHTDYTNGDKIDTSDTTINANNLRENTKIYWYKE